MTSLTKKPSHLNQIIFSSANYKTCRVFLAFDWVCSAYWIGEIPAQSHVRSSCFFANGVKVFKRCSVSHIFFPKNLAWLSAQYLSLINNLVCTLYLN